jgi:hypothetical protein
MVRTMKVASVVGGRPQFIKCAPVLTCPLWLYQPQCESRPARGDGFWCWRAVAQRTVRANPVIGLPPALHEPLQFPECLKQFPIQQFIS